MVEVTPADRDAAINLDELHIIQVWNIDRVAAAFASHRLAERAAIVAWLRGMGLRNINYIADDIEAVEHL